MAIVTFSRGCFSHGKEIAECVAVRLGYECVSQEILLEASQSFHVPEAKLFESLHDAPGLLDRITQAPQRFIDWIQAALLEHVVRDNVVYHGFAGHILLGGISHVLRVRVIADMEERVTLLRKRQKVGRKEALRLIEQEDRERAKWYRVIYNIDMHDPRHYDMVLHIGRLTIDDACDIVCDAVSKESFRATAMSRSKLADLALESHAKAVVEGICKADVKCTDGITHIRVMAQKIKSSGFASPDMQHQVRDRIQDDLYEEIVAAVSRIPGVKEIDCTIDLPYYV